MNKGSREAAESALARLCEWRGPNCYIYMVLEAEAAVCALFRPLLEKQLNDE